MSDVIYKKFSQLTETTILDNDDIIPVAQSTGGDFTSKKFKYSTLTREVSADLISPFTTSIQTTVNSSLSSNKWNSSYTTVQTYSASWNSTVSNSLTAFIQGNTSNPPQTQTVRYLSAGPVANASVAFIATGTGATLAQLPDGGQTGGNARGQYATDWQKARSVNSKVASGNYSVVGGGYDNRAAGVYSTIAGGVEGTATADFDFIGGGTANGTGGGASVVCGGSSNAAGGVGGTAAVVGGSNNAAVGSSNFIGGGDSNYTEGDNSCVVGGYANTASGDYSSILGGQLNDTNSKTNSHIIGSNITASDINYTYVNNISSQDAVHGSNFYGPNIIKAWVNFDGTAGGGAAINSSYNISSVTRNSAGTFTININSGVLANANYLVVGGGTGDTDVGVVVAAASEGGAPTNKTTTQCQINVRFYTTADKEPKEVYVMFIGL